MNSLAPPAELLPYSRAIARAGGRALLVGGSVRDQLLGAGAKDFDVEVFGLAIDRLARVLEEFGEVVEVGRAFGVLLVKGVPVDFSVPRRDNKVGRGHKDFRCSFDPDMSFAEAARRRDLTINSIGLDLESAELLDPHGGLRDLERGVLRATDRATFGEDPLRALRVAQFRARFEMEPDAELRNLCAQCDLSALSAERVGEEFDKLLLKGRRPSLGLELLRETGLLRYFPELEAMVGVPQDPEWHPEGTVWEHTLLVVDEAARARIGDADEDRALLYGALCHDLGKPATTITDEGGRIRSPNHEPEGVAPTAAFLARLRAPNALVERVCALTRHHLAPALLTKQESTPRAYRRLARKLGEAGVSITLLERVARADHFGRTTPDALARQYPAGDAFLDMAERLHVEEEPEPDVVLGRHLIARGMTPGRIFGTILDRCREIQDETGWSDPEFILAHFAQEQPGVVPDRAAHENGTDE